MNTASLVQADPAAEQSPVATFDEPASIAAHALLAVDAERRSAQK